MINWGGDEVARLEVQPSDTVLTGMLQIEEQLGVSVSSQRLVCGEDALEAAEVWCDVPIQILGVLERMIAIVCDN